MRERIAIDRLVFSAVDGEVGLTVAVQVKRAQDDAPLDRLLENAGADVHPMPGDFARKSDVERHQLHPHRAFDEYLSQPDSKETVQTFAFAHLPLDTRVLAE